MRSPSAQLPGGGLAAPRRKIGLKDIAAEAQTSVSTVSLALADHPRISLKTRQRIWKISDRLGYGAARRNGAKQAPVPQWIGFFVLDDDLDRPVYGTILMHLTALASQLGLRVEAASSGPNQDKVKRLDQLLRSAEKPDALILTGRIDAAIFQAVSELRTPCIVLGDPLTDMPVHTVTFDDAGAGRRATAHLIATGHTRIGFVSDTILPRGSGARWLDGYRLAHADAVLPVEARLIHATGVIDGLGTLPDALLDGAAAPTAYVAPNPFVGDELISALRILRRQAPVCTGRFRDRPDGRAPEGPHIRYSMAMMCQVALDHLTYLFWRRGQVPQQITIPFTPVNMD